MIKARYAGIASGLVMVAFGVGILTVKPHQNTVEQYPQSRAYILSERMKAMERAQTTGQLATYELTVAGSAGVPGNVVTESQ